MMCNHPDEAHSSGKKDYAMSCHSDMGKPHYLSDKALPGYRSFSMIWEGDEMKRLKDIKLGQTGCNNSHCNFITRRVGKGCPPN